MVLNKTGFALVDGKGGREGRVTEQHGGRERVRRKNASILAIATREGNQGLRREREQRREKCSLTS